MKPEAAPKDIKPRYDLTPDEITMLETELAHLVAEKMDEGEGVYAVWMNPGSKFADIIRTHEKEFWPDIDEIMQPHEERSSFLALLDTREENPAIVHGFRLSTGLPESLVRETGSTGLIIIDDIINSGQGFTTDDFVAYYKDRNIDLSECVSVETNFKIKKAERYNGLPMSQLGYIAIFDHLKDAMEQRMVYVFAGLNGLAVQSFQLVGIEYEPIAGRDDLRIPVSAGEFDDDYFSVAIPSSPKNMEVFENLIPLKAPSLDI